MDLVENLIKKMKKKGLTLAIAESCTGGLIASAITAKPGASAIFSTGFVTYSNNSKVKFLNVSQNILDQHGAVSLLTAEAMVKGLFEKTDADLALSVTGIAGPDGGTEKKPVGLVYFGYGRRGEQIKGTQENFQGSREAIRLQAVKFGLINLNSLL